MAAVPIGAWIFGSTVLAGGTLVALDESKTSSERDRKMAADKAAADFQSQTDAQLDAANKQQEKLDAQSSQIISNSNRDAAARRRRALATGATNTRDTILTSPLGVPGSPETANKTLLGS